MSEKLFAMKTFAVPWSMSISSFSSSANHFGGVLDKEKGCKSKQNNPNININEITITCILSKQKSVTYTNGK